MPANELAIDGGLPTLVEPTYAWPPVDDGIRQSLLKAYETGDWGRYHGSNCEALETLLRNYHQVESTQLTCSGTIAIEIALRAVGVSTDDEVIVAGYDFPGNFRAIEATGALPVLVDIDPSTWTLDAEQIESAITTKTKAIVVSHLHGGLADMPTIRQIGDAHGIRIVEDACQSPGAKIAGRVAGTWGDVGVLSFGGSKLLTSGRGGAILTNDPHISQRATVYRERGNDAFALSELQAAVLIPQLQLLDERNETRAEAVRLLTQQEINGLAPAKSEHFWRDRQKQNRGSYFKLAWLLSDHPARERAWFAAAIKAEGVTLQPAFRGFARRTSRRCKRIGELPNSKRAAKNTLLLHHPILLQPTATIVQVAVALKKVAKVWYETSIQGSQQASGN